MTGAAIRNKLHDYLEVVDLKKVKAFYTMFEADIEDTLSTNKLTDKQMEEVEKRHLEYLAGKSKTYTWEEAKNKIGKSK